MEPVRLDLNDVGDYPLDDPNSLLSRALGAGRNRVNLDDNWKPIGQNMMRLAVPGGWLVTNLSGAVALFIKDARHRWAMTDQETT